jgi:hypothetical protein
VTAKQLKRMLNALGISQRGAARALDFHERTMRRYCAGEPIPRVVEYALLYLASQANRGGAK